MSATCPAKRQLLDVTDMINTIKYMNWALHMASSGIGNLDTTNALQSISDEIDNRIEELGENLP